MIDENGRGVLIDWELMAGRLHIYYSQNKNFFRATFR
jgi:hypothetical protein